jgi:hypothetical protein
MNSLPQFSFVCVNINSFVIASCDHYVTFVKNTNVGLERTVDIPKLWWWQGNRVVCLIRKKVDKVDSSTVELLTQNGNLTLELLYSKNSNACRGI